MSLILKHLLLFLIYPSDEYPPYLSYLMVSGNPFVAALPDYRIRIVSKYLQDGGQECCLEELDEVPVTEMELDMAGRLYG